ncbi:Beta-amylase 1, chloroplastic [Galdieria sulphuraria]|uniref:Beta-amylase n=1 Tax=Galdieria sulphuraria TaxID=130081 RepID=M2W200_GALSU|nr:beta-amylase [Galdieria sulphuraria]EME29711.1 beta-amylase [Galdieria sulphuraria]GJD08000.1 Beta-amylase 1, chloroplastic [Galdieria sulphuraria]|eukprot:XP_005706231.1 beta-amylase [Galdieria sulphuraria]
MHLLKRRYGCHSRPTTFITGWTIFVLFCIACYSVVFKSHASFPLHNKDAAGSPMKGGSIPNAPGVPIYVMMPLTSVSDDGQLKKDYDGKNISWILEQWKKLGVEGLMVDIWFGLVEKEPRQYDWKPYIELCQLMKSANLKLQTVLSFHRCGGNVGDRCYIPLPKWIFAVAENDSDIFFKDRDGSADDEYLSWGIDEEPVLMGRTAVQVYQDFFISFRETFREFFGNVISQVQIGLGPAGELRYPSYQLNKWTFCGVGEFQCFDKYLLGRLQSEADKHGISEWGHPPYAKDVGFYNSSPSETLFFRDDGGMWNTRYGDFFLNWYSNELIQHADRVLTAATQVFFDLSNPNNDFTGQFHLAVKVAGVHWHFRSKAHASELTAGYYNTRYRNGYSPIFRVLKKHEATVVFTCMEMKDNNQPKDCYCSPEDLVGLIVRSSIANNISFAGENAVSFYDVESYRQISAVSRSYAVTKGKPMEAVTYLRWPEPIDIFFQKDTLSILGQKFFDFVRSMAYDQAESTDFPGL